VTPVEQSYSREQLVGLIARLPRGRRVMAADGQVCVRCGAAERPQVPVGRLRGVQVFECQDGCCS
jgi:hypothetical protein